MPFHKWDKFSFQSEYKIYEPVATKQGTSGPELVLALSTEVNFDILKAFKISASILNSEKFLYFL